MYSGWSVFLQPLYALLMMIRARVLHRWSDFFLSSYALFSLTGEGDSTWLGWLSLVLTYAAYDDKDEKAAWLGWFPSILTWRVVCSLSLA